MHNLLHFETCGILDTPNSYSDSPKEHLQHKTHPELHIRLLQTVGDRSDVGSQTRHQMVGQAATDCRPYSVTAPILIDFSPAGPSVSSPAIALANHKSSTRTMMLQSHRFTRGELKLCNYLCVVG